MPVCLLVIMDVQQSWLALAYSQQRPSISMKLSKPNLKALQIKSKGEISKDKEERKDLKTNVGNELLNVDLDLDGIVLRGVL